MEKYQPDPVTVVACAWMRRQPGFANNSSWGIVGPMGGPRTLRDLRFDMTTDYAVARAALPGERPTDTYGGVAVRVEKVDQ